ncbi:mannonate dehydratase [Maribacter aquivivus]|uniref:mannonate dehydratase n=1 Tax=Maribacter aquivivus TaxID=228958 RepID=UPI003CD0CBC1
MERKNLIEAFRLTWSVIENVPIYEPIKTLKGNYKVYHDNYIQTIATFIYWLLILYTIISC